MTKLEVKYSKVIDALGRVREGWIVFENELPGYPYQTKDEAIKQMEAIKQIRGRGAEA